MGTSDEDGDWPAGLSSVLSEKYLSWSWSWRSLELEKLKMTENDGDVAKPALEQVKSEFRPEHFHTDDAGI